jgi:GH35 family endo-1,4-beta-xylanase
MKEENGAPVSRETLLRRIETHVTTVAKRYADVATHWDVVNEAVADQGGNFLRDSVYSRTTGIDFAVTAFKAARAADPDALLVYNDYSDHKPAKRANVVAFLKELKRLGAPVGAYGMQGHFQIGEDPIGEIRNTFNAMRELGLKVVVSELDIDVIPRDRWWADGGKHREKVAKINPYPDGITDELQQQLASQYIELFKLFVENRDIIARVSFWNVHDEDSWLNHFPWERVNHPLLFDRQRLPKPAFDAVYQFLSASGR